MNIPSELSVLDVAQEFAATIATDAVREDLCGELRLQSGLGLRHYTTLTLCAVETPGAQYEGFTVMPVGRDLHLENAERLQIPADRNLWLARAVWAHLPRGDSDEIPNQLPRSKHLKSGYFWRNEDESWATDTRTLVDPAILGRMAQEQGVRANLLDGISRVGVEAVRSALQDLGDINVALTGANENAVYEARFDAEGIIDILRSYGSGRREDPGVVGHPMANALELLR